MIPIKPIKQKEQAKQTHLHVTITTGTVSFLQHWQIHRATFLDFSSSKCTRKISVLWYKYLVINMYFPLQAVTRPGY